MPDRPENDGVGHHRVLNGTDGLSGIDSLSTLLALERGAESFCNSTSLLNLGGGMLGGHIAALGLKAGAFSGVANPASLHMLFLSPPDPATPCDIRVEPIRDGRRFGQRSVRLTQGPALIARAAITLARPALINSAPNYRHDPAPPSAPDPESLATRAELLREERELPAIDCAILAGHPFLDIRFTTDEAPIGPGGRMWIRVPQANGLSPIDHYALLTLISDYWCALPVHRLPGAVEAMGRNFITTSIDHAIWFHDVPDCAGWLLCEMQALSAGGGMATMQGRAWSQDGRAVASWMQQALLVEDKR